MNTRSKFPAIPFTALLLVYALLPGLPGAPCWAKQEPASPAGQSAPPSDGQHRRFFGGNGVVGRIDRVLPGELKISTPDGPLVTVRLSSKTEIRLEEQPAKFEDLKAGLFAFVRGTKSGDGSWDAAAVTARANAPGAGNGSGYFKMEVIAGTVQAIDGASITVLRLDNTAATVTVDENTSLRKRRESITLADIHSGDSVIIRGETSNGAFVPKALNIVDPEQLQKIREFVGAGGPQGAASPSAGAPPHAPAAQTPPAEKKPPREPD